MPKKETFGKFILLGELERWGLGVEYRAAKLGPRGLERIVTVLRLDAALCADAAVARRLMDQVKLAAQLHGPNICRVLGIGKIESAYYICFEFMEGKSLRAAFDRCRQEGFPFSADHALLIASKVCSALEAAHASNLMPGERYFHGLLTPRCVHVSYEGDATVRGFGYWPGGLGEGRRLGADDTRYLAPEQAAGGPGDARSDIFAVGSLMFEALTGKALSDTVGPQDLSARLSQVRLQNPPGEDDSLPPPLLEILQRSLAGDPGARYAEIQEMRKAIDRLLFSGEFTPTTFNLAFFMHSLFRDDIEAESKLLRDEKEASYVAEEPVAEAAAGPAQASPEVAAPAPHATPAPVPAEPPLEPSPDTGPGFGMSRPEPKSKLPLLAGGAFLALVLGGGAIFMWGDRLVPPRPAPPPPTTLSTAAAAALARVEELEARLAELEAEKQAAETQAVEEARRLVESQAAARGRRADAETVARAEEAARKQKQAEQAKGIEAEKERLEKEKRAEEARLAEERQKAEERAALEAAKPPPTTQQALLVPPPTILPPTPPATTQPPTQRGMLVNLSDAGVVPPKIKKAPRVHYPPIALRQRVDGTVILKALIDENGKVIEVTVVTSAGGKTGLTEAAVKSLKKRVYNPATKDGVAVKAWLPVSVRFTLPAY